MPTKNNGPPVRQQDLVLSAEIDNSIPKALPPETPSSPIHYNRIFKEDRKVFDLQTAIKSIKPSKIASIKSVPKPTQISEQNSTDIISAVIFDDSLTNPLTNEINDVQMTTDKSTILSDDLSDAPSRSSSFQNSLFTVSDDESVHRYLSEMSKKDPSASATINIVPVNDEDLGSLDDDNDEDDNDIVFQDVSLSFTSHLSSVAQSYLKSNIFRFLTASLLIL
jgi:hypothetical protein